MEEKRGKADRNISGNNHQERSEPVRSRWTPKPEQILILESIFNSGMVNPPKDETIRIRKHLEQFGSVGDANVFYWFQNRRSRSRRRQRQLQAGIQAAGEKIREGSINISLPQVQVASGCGSVHQYLEGEASGNYISLDYSGSPSSYISSSSPTSYLMGSSSTCAVGDNGVESLYALSSEMGLQETDQQAPGYYHSAYYSSTKSSSLHFGNDGFVTIFINGVPTELPGGSIDIRALFGEDAILVHSSGLPVPTDEYGFLTHSLQHGDSYFLVSRQT